jgi:hypothetical protein
MRFVCFALTILAGIVCPVIASAQMRVELEQCRAITDDARRLECYDSITLGPSTRSKYDVVPLDELIDFALSYRGDLVEVTGWVTPGDDFFSLGIGADSEDSMPVDFKLLSRHERESFLDQCGEGCEATVQGTVRPVNFTTGIVADAIIAN